VRSYPQGELDFWAKYSEPDLEDESKRILYEWTKVMKLLKNLRQTVDQADAERVRQIYSEPEFSSLFCYRKGNKTKVLVKPALIARKLRNLEGKPRFWDYPDEEENED
jgi:hypothetical protein